MTRLDAPPTSLWDLATPADFAAWLAENSRQQERLRQAFTVAPDFTTVRNAILGAYYTRRHHAWNRDGERARRSLAAAIRRLMPRALDIAPPAWFFLRDAAAHADGLESGQPGRPDHGRKALEDVLKQEGGIGDKELRRLILRLVGKRK
jgi:hypothetical protein